MEAARQPGDGRPVLFADWTINCLSCVRTVGSYNTFPKERHDRVAAMRVPARRRRLAPPSLALRASVGFAVIGPAGVS